MTSRARSREGAVAWTLALGMLPVALADAQPPPGPGETSVAALLRQASLHESRGEYEAAIAGYDRAAEAAPSDAQVFLLRGSARFKAGRIDGSIEDFDRAAILEPLDEPYLWQRGISYYYAGRFGDCRAQFERHRLVNPNDVENAVWHLLCVAAEDGLLAAREAMLPVGPDARRPMKQIDDLFRGEGGVRQVEAAASDPASRFYADLYLGLYHELVGETERAEAAFRRAAALPNRGYMVEVARVHLKLRYP